MIISSILFIAFLFSSFSSHASLLPYVYAEEIKVPLKNSKIQLEKHFFLKNEKNETEFICRVFEEHDRENNITPKFTMAILPDQDKELFTYEAENPFMKCSYFLQTKIDFLLFKKIINAMTEEELQKESINRALDIANYREACKTFFRTHSTQSIEYIKKFETDSKTRPNPLILQSIVEKISTILLQKHESDKQKKERRKSLEGGDSYGFLNHKSKHFPSKREIFEKDEENFEKVL